MHQPKSTAATTPQYDEQVPSKIAGVSTAAAQSELLKTLANVLLKRSNRMI